MLAANMYEAGKESMKSARSTSEATAKKLEQAICTIAMINKSVKEKLIKMFPQEELGKQFDFIRNMISYIFIT